MYRLFSITAISVVLVSCASVPSTSNEDSSAASALRSAGTSLKGAFSSFSGAISGLLNRRFTEFKSLVEKNQLDRAADYYLANEKDFGNTDELAAVLATLAEKLNESYAGKNDIYGPGFEELIAKLDAYKAPGDVTSWQAVREDLAVSRKRLGTYDSVQFLKRAEYRTPLFAKLEAAMNSVHERIVAGADPAFAAYDHLAAKPFFEVYPDEVPAAKRAELVKRAADAWIAALSRGKLADVERLVRLYGSEVDDPDKRAAISSAAAAAMMRENGWRQPLSLSQALQVSDVLNKLSLPGLTSTPKVEVVLVAADEADAKAWAAARPGISARVVAAPQFDAQLKLLATRKADRPYLFVDLTNKFAHKGMTHVSTRRNQRVVAQREEANPEWHEAVRALREAESRAQEVRQMDAQTQSQARQLGAMGGLSQLQALTALGASGMSSWASRQAEKDVNEARQRVNSTPRTVFKAVTESYETGVATYEAVKGYRVAMYAIEPGATRFKRFEMADMSRITAETEIGIDPRDERKAAVEARNTEALARLERFVSISTAPQAGQVLTHVASAAPAGEMPTTLLTRQRDLDQRMWQMISSTEQRRLSAQSAAAQIRAEQFAAMSGGAQPGAPAVIQTPGALAARTASVPAPESSAPAGNPFTQGFAANNPFLANAAPTPKQAQQMRSGGGGAGYDCKAEEQRILQIVNSSGYGGASICQSGKEMLRIANEALPFYERCPITDPKGEMRAWARDTKVKAQGMIDSSCVEQQARPRPNPDLRGGTRRPAPTPAARQEPQPSSRGGGCYGCGHR